MHLVRLWLRLARFNRLYRRQGQEVVCCIVQEVLIAVIQVAVGVSTVTQYRQYVILIRGECLWQRTRVGLGASIRAGFS